MSRVKTHFVKKQPGRLIKVVVTDGRLKWGLKAAIDKAIPKCNRNDKSADYGMS